MHKPDLPSRRSMLAGIAAVIPAAAVAVSVAAAAPTDDPVFAAIEACRAAYEAYGDAFGRMTKASRTPMRNDARKRPAMPPGGLGTRAS